MKRAPKILLRIIAGLSILTIAGMAFLWNAMYEPFVLPPEIGRDLPADFHQADLLFKERVAKSYLSGTRESELVTRLKSDGFSVLAEQQLASFSKTDFPCTLRWLITWKSMDQRVTKLEGRYDSSCL